MKRNQIILVAIFVFLTALIFFRIQSNKKAPIKETKEAQTLMYVPIAEVENKIRTSQLISYGQVAPNTEIEISFEVQGKLEKGDLLMKPGVKFKFNQLLYKVNQDEAFYSLTSRKTQLANLIITALPDIELDFPSEKNKWMQFLDQLGPERRLPELPSVRSSKERMFITARNIFTEYYSIKSQESRMEKYFYLAPFNGTVVEVYSEPGSIVSPGMRVAKIAKSGDFEVKVPIAMSNLDRFQKEGSADFFDSKGKKIGTGKILRISDVINQKTQSVDVYYSISPVNNAMVYHGQYLNAAINQSASQECFPVPRAAVKDNKVQVLANNKLLQRDINIVGSKPDTVFVVGLRNGEEVLLERVIASSDVKEYKGIKR